MVNVTGPQCAHPGCTTRPSFNAPGVPLLPHALDCPMCCTSGLACTYAGLRLQERPGACSALCTSLEGGGHRA